MKLKVWYSLIFSIVLIFCFIDTVDSQVVVERSKDKVTILGKQYYVHSVKKGETVYSISKAYNITEIELTKENPSALYGVKENQSLKISVIESTVVAVSRDETKYTYYKLGPGDTIYSLSKKYDVSEDQIIAANPKIDIYKLPVGAEIAIPKKQLMVVQQNFENQDQNILFHKVEKGETLSSIARKYGIALKDLRKENNGLIFPKVNDYVRVPKANISAQMAPVQVIVDTVKAIPIEEPVNVTEIPLAFTSIKKLNGSINVALLLPFYLNENSKRSVIDSSQFIKGKRIYTTVNRSEDWIYGPSKNFIEMYEGILLAIDTLKSLGLSINLSTYDIQSDSIALKTLLASGKLQNMNLIIGPVYSNNLAIMSAYANRYGIPVVSPVPLKSNSILINNPNLYIVNPSIEAAQEALASKISEYYNYNLVLIHSDSAKTDSAVINFKNAIFRELTYKVPYEEIRFREFVFYSRTAFDNDSINRLAHVLSAERKNLVIVASEDAPAMGETITNLDVLSKQFDITILGYPAMRGLKNTDPKYFYENGIMLYSPFWIDLHKEKIKQFIKDFRSEFYTEPIETSFGWQGYDLAYYFMSGIAMYGKAFPERMSAFHPELLSSDYIFKKKSKNDGYENRILFLIKYSKEMEISVVDEKNSTKAAVQK